MRSLNYLRASSKEEACRLLAEHEDEARILAGGQSLLNMMKLRIASPPTLIDTHRVAELQGIAVKPGGLAIGSMATYAKIQAADLGARYAMIQDAVEVIADMHVRHMGTMGGSCCHADPYADMPNVATALAVEMEASTVKATRRIAVEEFFVGPLETALAPAELLAAIHVPALPAGTGSAYEKFSWRRGDYAIVSIAAVLTVEASGKCKQARIVAGALGNGPTRLDAAEEALADRVLNDSVIEHAARAGAAGCEPQSDRIYGSAEYKRLLVETLTVRSVKRALERARADLKKGEA